MGGVCGHDTVAPTYNDFSIATQVDLWFSQGAEWLVALVSPVVPALLYSVVKDRTGQHNYASTRLQ